MSGALKFDANYERKQYERQTALPFLAASTWRRSSPIDDTTHAFVDFEMFFMDKSLNEQAVFATNGGGALWSSSRASV
jgi:hypothetical protein